MDRIFVGSLAGAVLGMMVGWLFGRAALDFQDYDWNTKEQLLVWMSSAYGFLGGAVFGGIAGFIWWRKKASTKLARRQERR